MAVEKDYVLGTHDAEIERLGLQHRVWRPQASQAWKRAGFTAGQTLVDLGCGPGNAALDLAEIVGSSGKLVAVDRSRRFLDALEGVARARKLTWLETCELDLDEQALPSLRADGIWSRWVYSFVRKPETVLARAAAALRPGGVMVMLEYVDYRAWRLSPDSEVFDWFVSEVMASWRATGGEPDIGLSLPRWLDALGFDLVLVRPITELARPRDFLWQWPKAFVGTGLQRLVDLGRVDGERARAVQAAFDLVERSQSGFLLTPTVLEIIARKR
jgi:SAM-dependent methyltransferase